MNLLKEGILNQSVLETTLNKKLTIDGYEKIYKVYKIKLSDLYYNDKNDRIATYINEYNMNNKIKLKDLNKDEYNDIIHNFIKESNKEAFKKTKQNIELIGQQEFAVVLADGRIIDGNRRYTCLRSIQRKKMVPQYIEAIILNYDIKNDEKKIKSLELVIQHGTDSKVSYNPIERIVGVYNDIVDKKIFTEKEYAAIININQSELKTIIDQAILLEELLLFMNTPKQFHLARTLNLADPLRELSLILKKIKNQDQKEEFKNIIFSQLLVQADNDMSKYIRKTSKIANHPQMLNNFIEEQNIYVEKVCDKIENIPQITSKELNEIIITDEVKNDFHQSTIKWIEKVNSLETRNTPIKFTEKAYDVLLDIDPRLFTKLTYEQKKELSTNINEIIKLTHSLKEQLEEDDYIRL